MACDSQTATLLVFRRKNPSLRGNGLVRLSMLHNTRLCALPFGQRCGSRPHNLALCKMQILAIELTTKHPALGILGMSTMDNELEHRDVYRRGGGHAGFYSVNF